MTMMVMMLLLMFFVRCKLIQLCCQDKMRIGT